MITFRKYVENRTAQDVTNAFSALGSGIGDAAQEFIMRYVKRIMAGEAPDQVLQGLNPNGNTVKNVMQKVQELKSQQAQPQQAQPQQAQPQQAQPQQVSLGSLADKISDENWHFLYDYFSQRYPKSPGDPALQQLAQALYKAAQSGDMKLLQPFAQKYLGRRLAQ